MTTSPAPSSPAPRSGREDVDAILAAVGDPTTLHPQAALERLGAAHEELHRVLTSPGPAA